MNGALVIDMTSNAAELSTWSLLAGVDVSDQVPSVVDYAIAFGPFRLFPAQQLLLEDERPLRLGSRALEILTFLTARPGELVSKEDLIARVWPDTFVEEGNLRVHIAALRRTLGDGQAGNRYVMTVPGRGYRFVAPVRGTLSTSVAPESRSRLSTRDPHPVSITRQLLPWGIASLCMMLAAIAVWQYTDRKSVV